MKRNQSTTCTKFKKRLILQFKSIEDRPAFQAYWAGLAERPAHKRATDLDNAAMPEQ